MKWLITGTGGFLGSALAKMLLDEEVVALEHSDLDVTDRTAVAETINYYRPDVVINAAADKRVDAIEKDDAYANQVNALAPAYLAEACAESDALFIHISADYVFDGMAHVPYKEDDPTNPISAYGRTKADGERNVLNSTAKAYVIRTAWLYGDGGPNFVKSILKLEQERDVLTVVADQHGSPTWVQQLANGILTLAQVRPPFGIYHCANIGSTTWYGLACAVFEEIGADTNRIQPIGTEQLQLVAPRPRYTVLDHEKWKNAGLPAMLPWREALAQAFNHDFQIAHT